MVEATDRKRQPKGIPVGGQFAENSHDEALTSLEDDPSPFLTDVHERINSADFKERARIAHEELSSAVEALDQDENWQKYLNQASKFHTYSFTNQMLIYIQNPDATRVNSYKRWVELGRSPKKGAKAIYIFAPMFRKEKDEDGKEEKKLFGFKPVPVFDVSQTEGEPLAEVWNELSEEPKEGYVEDLHAAIEAHGYRVEYRDLSKQSKRGFTSAYEPLVVVDSSTSAGTQAATLAHELGHIACGHLDRIDEYHTGHGGKRGRMEVEAESFAYILNRINGMETSAKSSSEYVAGWQRDDPSELSKAGDTVAKVVKKVLGDGSAWRNAVG